MVSRSRSGTRLSWLGTTPAWLPGNMVNETNGNVP